jgi:pimeloyl-ACP methyl ester carboxylesterase
MQTVKTGDVFLPLHSGGDMSQGEATYRRMAGHLLLVVALLLQGCTLVSVKQGNPKDFDESRRGDVLTTGKLSFATRNTLSRLALDPDKCAIDTTPCIDSLRSASIIDTDARLSALAELALGEALKADKTAGNTGEAGLVGDYLDAARYAYAYLFFGDRSPRERAFEDRQTQVRDNYNYSVERVASLMFQRGRHAGRVGPALPGSIERVGRWQLSFGQIDLEMPAGASHIREMLPASRLRIGGLTSVYRRDGLGAELVLVAQAEAASKQAKASPFEDTGYLPVTALLHFPGDSLGDVLNTQQVVVDALDPYQRDSANLHGISVPLAANFSAPYALWLAHSGFGRQAIDNLLGRGEALDHPRVFLMQPYDPKRMTVVMIHGLASSPEAWINLANDVMGDDALRKRYQIWEVYYPTNAPIPVNLAGIRAALAQTFATLDPTGKAPASQHITLIGHSMGGVIARLLVVDSGDSLWEGLFKAPPGSARRKRLAMLAPYLSIKPLPGVDEAIFLASPHAGTPLAGEWLARMANKLIRLPKTLLDTAARMADVLAGDLPEQASLFRQAPTGLDLLRDTSPYLRATSKLSIVPGVAYHSIIARRDAEGPLEKSSDGLVPYQSAHLAGAVSELVVVSGHSVQEKPQAILEIRRILRAHAASLRPAPPQQQKHRG